ncbi:hypothetical protein GUJ93_ZPchr0011g27213 [Zizania palustris]|uniref:ApaG domain-containing protein n=1 Tax=Zizania palustris TaxID=103762 RepID=A0A8J5WHE5_ZIZPA|nr:hypothetical protein GUJ93_ZPchr0011g27213 [Zizania palustris]
MSSPPVKRQRVRGDAALSPLENLPPLLLARILVVAGPRGAAVLACTSATLRAAASSEEFWRRLCAKDFGLVAPLDTCEVPLPFFMGAYKSWFQTFGMYPLPLVKRVKFFWDSFNSWLYEFFPEAQNTLLKGVSDLDIRKAEHDLGFQLPMHTKVLYRFCNGQMCREDLVSHGVIGGYEFDSNTVNVQLLPLEKIVQTAKLLPLNNGASCTSKFIVVAASSDWQKSFLLDCLTGQLYVGTKSFKSDGGMMPCVPSIMLPVHGNKDMPLDGLLLWLEEHFRRLQSGMIKLQHYNYNYMDNARHICLYPEEPPSYSSAVTYGIKVRASAVFAPEDSALNEDPCKYMYFFCICLHLSEACIIDGKHYSSCQCQSLHLTIRSGNNVLQDNWTYDVQLRRAGAVEIIYRYYIAISRAPASIEGTINFVPLRYNTPQGRQFAVKIAPFILQLPEYIY